MTEKSTNEPTPISESNEHQLRLLEKIKKLPLTQQNLLEDLINGLGEGTTKDQRQAAKNVVMAILNLVPQDVIFIQQIKQLPKDQWEDLHRFILEQLDPIPDLETLASGPLLSSINESSRSSIPSEPLPNVTEIETEELAQNAFGRAAFHYKASETNEKLQDDLLPDEEDDHLKNIVDEESLSTTGNNDINELKEVENSPPETEKTEFSTSLTHTEPVAESEITLLKNSESATEDAESKLAESAEGHPIDDKISLKDSDEIEKPLDELQVNQSTAIKEAETEEPFQEIKVENQETPTEHVIENSNDGDITPSNNGSNEIIQSDNLIQIDVFGKGLVINTQKPIDGLEEALSLALRLKFRNVFGLLKSVDKNAFEILDQQLIDELVEKGIIIVQVCYPVAFSDQG